jgi:hypothetical protein
MSIPERLIPNAFYQSMMEEAAAEQMKKTLPWSVERALLPHSPRN